MAKEYPAKLIAYTRDPFAGVKAASLGNPEEIGLYDSQLYSLYLVNGSRIFRNGTSKLRPNSNEYKEVSKAAADC
jgi:hypothetical protein